MGETAGKVGIILWVVRHVIKPFLQALDLELAKREEIKIEESILQKLNVMSKERLEFLINDKTSQEVIATKADFIKLRDEFTALKQAFDGVLQENKKVREDVARSLPDIQILREQFIRLNDEDVKQEVQISDLRKQLEVVEQKKLETPIKVMKAKDVKTNVLEFS